MKQCKNCRHDIRRIKGTWKHRMEHFKYSGIGGSGGVTFNETCLNQLEDCTFCRCDNPIPDEQGRSKVK